MKNRKYIIYIMSLVIVFVTFLFMNNKVEAVAQYNIFADSPGGCTVAAKDAASEYGWTFVRNRDGQWTDTITISLGTSLSVAGGNPYDWADIWWYKAGTAASKIRTNAAFYYSYGIMYTVTPNSAGTWYLATNSADNENQPVCLTVNVTDTSAPGATTVTYNSGANSCAWKNNYNITLSASDNAGIAYYEIDVDNNGTADATTGYNFIPPNGWSTCVARFRAVDPSGNRGAWTATHHIHMDTELPGTTTVTYNSGANTCSWKNNYNITLSASDNIGIAYYEIDWNSDGTADTTTAAGFIAGNNFDACTVRFRAVDHAGNRGAWTGNHHIHQDTEAPSKTTVNLNGYTSGTLTTSNVTQSFSATDNIGVTSYQYSYDKSSVNACSNPWTIDSEGEWTIYARALDAAGNAGAWSDAYVIKIRKEVDKTIVLKNIYDVSGVERITVYVKKKSDVSYGTAILNKAKPNLQESVVVTLLPGITYNVKVESWDSLNNKSEEVQEFNT